MVLLTMQQVRQVNLPLNRRYLGSRGNFTIRIIDTFTSRNISLVCIWVYFKCIFKVALPYIQLLNSIISPCFLVCTAYHFWSLPHPGPHCLAQGQVDSFGWRECDERSTSSSSSPRICNLFCGSSSSSNQPLHFSLWRQEGEIAGRMDRWENRIWGKKEGLIQREEREKMGVTARARKSDCQLTWWGRGCIII